MNKFCIKQTTVRDQHSFDVHSITSYAMTANISTYASHAQPCTARYCNTAVAHSSVRSIHRSLVILQLLAWLTMVILQRS
jgi:hypothetical protein